MLLVAVGTQAQELSSVSISTVERSKQYVRQHDSLIFISIDGAIPPVIRFNGTLSNDETYYVTPALSAAATPTVVKSKTAKVGGDSVVNTFYKYQVAKTSNNKIVKTYKIFIDQKLSLSDPARGSSASFTVKALPHDFEVRLLEAESPTCIMGNDRSMLTGVINYMDADNISLRISGPRRACGGAVNTYKIDGIPTGYSDYEVEWMLVNKDSANYDISKFVRNMTEGMDYTQLNLDEYTFTGNTLDLNLFKVEDVNWMAKLKARVTFNVGGTECFHKDLDYITIEARQGAPADVTNIHAGCVTQDGLLKMVADYVPTNVQTDPTRFNWVFSEPGMEARILQMNDDNLTLDVGENFSLPLHATIYVENNCGAGDNPQNLQVHYTARFTQWTGAKSSAWEDDDNWTNGVPGSCSDAIITTAGNYPVISSDTYVNLLTFEPRAGVKGLEHLAYDSAVVDMKLDRDRWYSICAPLKDMYSGDYYFNGYPLTYMKKFNSHITSVTGKSILYEGTWSASFGALDEPMDLGTGVLFMISENNANWSVEHDSVFMSFPNMSGEKLVQEVYSYHALTGNLVTSLSFSMPKDNQKAFRFIVEDDNDDFPDYYTVHITNTKKGNKALVPNHILCHLKPEKFISRNSAKLKSYIYLWDGSSKTFYSYSTTSHTGTKSGMTNMLIAPMQSFLVELQDGVDDAGTGSNPIYFYNADYEKDTERAFKMRSASEPAMASLHLTYESQEEQSYASLTTGVSEQSAELDGIDKMFNTVRKSSELYLDCSGQRSLEMALSKGVTGVFPIGFRDKNGNEKTKEDGVLKFEGADNFDHNLEVMLIDKEADVEINLRDTQEYPVAKNTKTGDLYIEIRQKENVNTGVEEQATVNGGKGYVTVKNVGNMIEVNSNEQIDDVTVFNSAGKTLYKGKPMSSYATIVLNEGIGAVTVRAVTNTQVTTEKILLK